MERFIDTSSKQKMPNGRGVPFKSEGSRHATRKADPEPIVVHDESDRYGDGEDRETDAGLPAPTQKKGRQTKRVVSREPEATQPVRKARMNRAKGKEKAVPETSAEVMEVDGTDDTDHIQELPPPVLNMRKQNPHGLVPVTRKHDERERKKLDRLEKLLEDV